MSQAWLPPQPEKWRRAHQSGERNIHITQSYKEELQ